jgi:hypothetical protein
MWAQRDANSPIHRIIGMRRDIPHVPHVLVILVQTFHLQRDLQMFVLPNGKASSQYQAE